MTDAPVPAASVAMLLARPLLFSLDAEDAHRLTLQALQRVSAMPRVLDVVARRHRVEDARLRVHAMGLDFPNPIGVAAGLDKDAVAIPALGALGFGFVEAGTVTPRPQEGNARPRVFRLPSDGAAINRLGFPSEGVARVHARLEELDRAPGCVVGVNVGRNKATPNESAAEDLVACVEPLRAHADFVVVNVSSPNTPGLRELQDARALRDLVTRVVAVAGLRPVLVKLSPDMHDADFDVAVDASLAGGARGLVVANTTVTRPPTLLHREVAREAGGLSGAPLFARTEALVRRAARVAPKDACLVGVGGVSSGDDAWQMLVAGASLVEAYTAIVYAGPTFARRALQRIVELLDATGAKSVAEVTAAGRG